jgi:hypothetical protein
MDSIPLLTSSLTGTIGPESLLELLEGGGTVFFSGVSESFAFYKPYLMERLDIIKLVAKTQTSKTTAIFLLN